MVYLIRNQLVVSFFRFHDFRDFNFPFQVTWFLKKGASIHQSTKKIACLSRRGHEAAIDRLFRGLADLIMSFWAMVGLLRHFSWVVTKNGPLFCFWFTFSLLCACVIRKTWEKGWITVKKLQHINKQTKIWINRLKFYLFAYYWGKSNSHRIFFLDFQISRKKCNIWKTSC
jgi:hypothetical protein